MTDFSKVVGDHWNAFSAQRGDTFMFVSFDEDVASVEMIEELSLCARVWWRIQEPNPAGGPESPETEKLWEMEDELLEMLDEHKVACRFVARLTYGGIRELVFQLADWDSFRPPVGRWLINQADYEIDVSEHEGWGFYDDVVRPSREDRFFMLDNSVIMNLIESGSDPEKEHSLEYAFTGNEQGLRRVAISLQKRGYSNIGELDFTSGQIVMAKLLKLDVTLIVNESLTNADLAEDAGVEFDGWGAAVVS